MAKKVNPFEQDIHPPFPGFPEDALRFLQELKESNTREWFTQHKPRYEASVKTPMLSLLAVLAERMKEIDEEIELDAKTSMYRIYRDVRFSADKSPYKTHTAAAFTLRGYNRKTDAAFYFHITPGEIGIGGGLYAPSGEQLKKLRSAIAENADDLHAILSTKEIKGLFGGLTGDSLKRIPRGFDSEHPEAELLMRKQFLLWTTVPEQVIFRQSFTDTLVKHFSAMTPFIRYLLRYT
jgi:uncharacterized protein (TIGR02453 family)